jgi:S-adenosylhomocysteine hydrolase
VTKSIGYYDFRIDLHSRNDGNEFIEVQIGSSPELGDYRPITTTLASTDIARLCGELDNDTIDTDEIRQLGTALSKIALPDEGARDMFRRAWRYASEHHLRLRLRMVLWSPRLARLPWEYLWSDSLPGEEHLALNPDFSIVRHEPMQEATMALPRDRKLRLLAAFASPTGLPALNIGQHREALRSAVPQKGPGQLPITFVEVLDATRRKLREALRTPTDIFHFTGHGGFTVEYAGSGEGPGVGWIALVGNSGAEDRLSGDDLAADLQSAGVRLAVLGACQSARRDSVSAWTGVAPALIRAGVAAVVGMQFEISHENAVVFSEAFYRSVAAGATVDEAVWAGRRAIKDHDKNGFAWAIPVLYLRSRDGRVLMTDADEEHSAEPSRVSQTVRTIGPGGMVIGQIGPGSGDIRQVVAKEVKGTMIGQTDQNPILGRNRDLTGEENGAMKSEEHRFDESSPIWSFRLDGGKSPLLNFYSKNEKLRTLSPFAGKRCIFVLHFLRDLVPFVEACQRLGLELRKSMFFYKRYRYPYREEVSDWLRAGGWLREEGAEVAPLETLDKILARLDAESSTATGSIVVVEDGGYVVPAALKNYPRVREAILGAVEQTTRGLRNDEDALGILRCPSHPDARVVQRSTLTCSECPQILSDVTSEAAGPIQQPPPFPILSVASSTIKALFEPPYIAHNVFQNLERLLPDVSFRGASAAVLGYGTIGRDVARELRANGVNVTVYDLDHEKLLQATEDGFNWTDSSPAAVSDRDLVIGTSGTASIGQAEFAKLRSGTVVVSSSSEQVEIRLEELRQQAIAEHAYVVDGKTIGSRYKLPRNREVTVIADGFPINFWDFESMPYGAAELVMTLMFLSAIEVAVSNGSLAAKIDAQAVNEIAKRYELARTMIQFTRS